MVKNMLDICTKWYGTRAHRYEMTRNRMIDVSDLPISCSVFLFNISGIHTLIINICLDIYLVHVLGLYIMDIISVGVLDLGAAQPWL